MAVQRVRPSSRMTSRSESRGCTFGTTKQEASEGRRRGLRPPGTAAGSSPDVILYSNVPPRVWQSFSAFEDDGFVLLKSNPSIESTDCTIRMNEMKHWDRCWSALALSGGSGSMQSLRVLT